ncbi:MAG: pyridoxal-phosphate dependent enzyme [Vampirovibrionales bacterium]|nr:pyridoxal-phosphate dependent enzyme [Vampirovibrionales bacterium]
MVPPTAFAPMAAPVSADPTPSPEDPALKALQLQMLKTQPLPAPFALPLSAYQAAHRQLVQLCQVHGALTPQQPCVTPLTPSTQFKTLYYKQENLTPVGAYKFRGAQVGMALALQKNPNAQFLACSTGNHALAVLKAAEWQRPAGGLQLILPKNTVGCKVLKITQAIEALVRQGVKIHVDRTPETFAEAHALTQTRLAANPALILLHPYETPNVVAGQGTIGVELYAQLLPLLKATPSIQSVQLISPVGGGGLLAGTAQALTQLVAAQLMQDLNRPVSLKILGLSLATQESLLGDAIRVKHAYAGHEALFAQLGITLNTMADAQMAQGIAVVKQDIGATVEGPSGGTLTPVLEKWPGYQPTDTQLTVCLLSGGNLDLQTLQQVC